MNKLKAYTISELVVALVVTAIVISIAGSILLLVKKQYSTYQSSNKELFNINLFQSLLNKDIENAERIYWGNNRLRLETGVNAIVYTFDESKVVRIQKGQTDEFLIQTNDLTIQSLEDKDLVYTVAFEIVEEKHTYPVSLKKEYAPSTLLNPITNNTYLAP